MLTLRHEEEEEEEEEDEDHTSSLSHQELKLLSDGLRTKQNNNSPSSHRGDCDLSCDYTLKIKLHL